MILLLLTLIVFYYKIEPQFFKKTPKVWDTSLNILKMKNTFSILALQATDAKKYPQKTPFLAYIIVDLISSIRVAR